MLVINSIECITVVLSNVILICINVLEHLPIR